ncbi:hypothetical protein ACHAXS_010643 [Conticribra weissflogii]
MILPFQSFMIHTALLLAIILTPTSGFAAWLKCNRYLEEDEIVMNNRVLKAQADEDSPLVKLAVFDSSGSRVDVPSEDPHGDSFVWIDDEMEHSTLSFDIRLDSETVGNLADIQFVVETTPFQEEDVSSEPKAPSPNVPSYSERPSSPAPAPAPAPVPAYSRNAEESKSDNPGFVSTSTGGGIMCDGRRGHARGKSGYVKYVLGKAKDSNKNKSEQHGNVELEDALGEVWAGWSQNHGPVKLTPRIIFKRKEDSIETDIEGRGQGEL